MIPEAHRKIAKTQLIVVIRSLKAKRNKESNKK